MKQKLATLAMYVGATFIIVGLALYIQSVVCTVFC